MDVLTPDALARDLAIPDLTDPAQTSGPHAVQHLVTAIAGALALRWRCDDVRVVRAHPIVSSDDNYDRLGFPPDAITRDARYSRYVSETCLLRTHTSALIPPALRRLAAEPDGERPRDVLLVCPGLVYRRDAIDRLHTGTPHQLDVWRVRANDPAPLTTDDLLDMIATVVEAALPGARHRVEPRSHPYTTGGLQIDVQTDGGEWVEVGECGLAAAAVLAGAGLDAPAQVTGLAMGLGLDRLVMLRKGIGDIRLLRSTDPRVTSQLADLEPYRPVSNHPEIKRDVSVAVAPGTTEEDLGDRVRDALGDDADAVETVAILSETAATGLPPAAVARLGIASHQTNVLLRVVLRHVDRTLTGAEANGLRDRIYAALHEGTS